MTCTVVMNEGAAPQIGVGITKVIAAIFGAPIDQERYRIALADAEAVLAAVKLGLGYESRSVRHRSAREPWGTKARAEAFFVALGHALHLTWPVLSTILAFQAALGLLIGFVEG
jgi:hypothetical protein